MSPAASIPSSVPGQSARRKNGVAWLVLVAGLLITVAAALFLKANIENLAEQKFFSVCDEIQKTIAGRLNDYARLLYGGAALFAASDHDMISREVWHHFTETQRWGTQLSFIQGLGFSLLIPRAELPAHLQQIRRDGFPEYTVKPEGDREIYTSIIYLEPFTGRNLRAFGYDMFSEPVRRAAMERARDTNRAALSGKVILMQETGQDEQAGTLMYVPVYHKGMPKDSVQQRRAAIYGWVYSPYRMNDLMQGIFGDHSLKKENQLHLQIFDGRQCSSDSLLYEFHPLEAQKRRHDLRFSRQITVNFHDQPWTLYFTQIGAGLLTMEYIGVWLILAGGTLITLLLFGLINILLNARAEAQQLVEERTSQLAKMMQEISIILDNAPIGIVKIIDRQQVWANHKIEELFQYSKEELAAQTTRKLYLSEEAYDQLGREAYPLLAQGLVFETEQEIIRKDGAHLFIRCIGKALEPHDLSQGIIWLVENITERQQAEEKIRKSKQQYDNLVANIPIGVYILRNTPKKTFTLDYVSPRMAEMLDTSVDSLLADSRLVLQAIHPDDKDAFIRMHLEGMHQRQRFAWEGQVLIKGAVKWLQMASSPEPLANGDILWHGMVADITERKQAEAALKESEEKFRTVADYTYGWEVWEDPQGNYLYCSPSCACITGYSQESFMADPGLLERLIHADDQPGWRAHYISVHSEPQARNIPPGSANEFDFRIIRPDGQIRWLSHICYHIVDGEGRDLGHRISNRDITERKLLEAELLKARNLESIGILAGGIAHDFNNLLQALSGNIEIAKMMIGPAGQAFSILEQAEQAAGLAGKLTKELIALSPGGNFLPMLIEPANYIREEAAAVDGTSLAVDLDLADNLWPITADPAQFRNVIQQLVQNAMEAMSPAAGGQLRIRAVNESLAPDHKTPPALAPGNYVKILFQDQGRGISSEHLPRIFDPYFSTKERGSQKGMGLGLALCEAIIKKHGGAITVRSTPGKGTTFTIYLPAVMT